MRDSDDTGCRDGSRNDGIVCHESARFLFGMANGPSSRWADPKNAYAHTGNWKSLFVFCGNWGGSHPTLYDPPVDDVDGPLKAISDTILNNNDPFARTEAIASPQDVIASSDGRWYYRLTIRETHGVGVKLKSLKANNKDYSPNITDWFGTDYLPPNGSLSVDLTSWGYKAPADLIWRVGGTDDAGHPQILSGVRIHLNK